MNKHFEPGSKVIILEPTDSRKLFNSWSEPKEVTRKLGERTYEVKIDEKTMKAFHINQLRQWNERVDFVAQVVIKTDETINYEDKYIQTIDDDMQDETAKFRVEPSLPSDQRTRLLEL
jgi:hypothetical protein